MKPKFKTGEEVNIRKYGDMIWIVGYSLHNGHGILEYSLNIKGNDKICRHSPEEDLSYADPMQELFHQTKQEEVKCLIKKK